MMPRRHHNQAHRQRLRYLRAAYPVRRWYYGIGRVASNIAGCTGLPQKKQRARGGKRNEPAQWQLTGEILFVGMISNSAPPSGLFDWWLMIAFTILNSNLVPFLEGLCSSNPCRFEFSVFWVFADLGIDSSALWARCTVLVIQFFLQTAPSPIRIGRKYFHTAMFISRQDMQSPITLNLKFPISKNSVFKDQDLVSKIWQKSSKRKIAGLRPASFLAGLCPSPHPGGY